MLNIQPRQQLVKPLVPRHQAVVVSDDHADVSPPADLVGVLFHEGPRRGSLIIVHVPAIHDAEPLIVSGVAGLLATIHNPGRSARHGSEQIRMVEADPQRSGASHGLSIYSPAFPR